MVPINPLEKAKRFIRGLGADMKNHFLLTWHGDRVPKGACMDGVPIADDFGGVVRSHNFHALGYCDWVDKNGGADHHDRCLVIHTNCGSCTPPEGGTVERV